MLQRGSLAILLLLLLTPRALSDEIAENESGESQREFHSTTTVETTEPPSSSTTVLTLADLQSMAFEHNPTLSAAAARINAARGKQIQAGLSPNPVVGYHAMQIGNLSTAGQQGGFIAQRLITGGKLALDQAAARKATDAAHFQFHAQERRVLSDVQIRFYDTLVAQQRVVLTEQLAGIGDQLVEATEKLLAARHGTDNDLLQAEIRADESRILLDNARNEYIASWRRLVFVVGVPSLSYCPLDGRLDADLPELNWDSCSTFVLSGNPEISAARARADRARLVIQRAKREPVPDIDILVSHRHDNITDDNVTNVQVGVPVPIFDRNQGNICSAEAEWVSACQEVRRLELELQDRLAVAFRRYANARQQVERYSARMVPRARRSLELVTDGYEKGQVEYLTLLTAQTTYLQVSLSRLDSLRELRTAASVIEGQLLIDSLVNRNGS